MNMKFRRIQTTKQRQIFIFKILKLQRRSHSKKGISKKNEVIRDASEIIEKVNRGNDGSNRKQRRFGADAQADPVDFAEE